MKRSIKIICFFALWAALISPIGCAQQVPSYLDIPNTYCNPMNLDYAYIPSTHKYYAQDQSHRSTADPAVVKLRDTLYLFSTKQNGYWWSADMRKWNFVKQDFQSNGIAADNVCAPGAWAWGDTLLFIPSFAAPGPMPQQFQVSKLQGMLTPVMRPLPGGLWTVRMPTIFIMGFNPINYTTAFWCTTKQSAI